MNTSTLMSFTLNRRFFIYSASTSYINKSLRMYMILQNCALDIINCQDQQSSIVPNGTVFKTVFSILFPDNVCHERNEQLVSTIELKQSAKEPTAQTKKILKWRNTCVKCRTIKCLNTIAR